MAGAMDENATEHFITCNVCYLQFDEDLVKPKLLPCSHTVCIQCLRAIYNNGREINCPECRQIVRCEQGVDKLPTHHSVLHIIKLDEKLRCQKLNCLDERLEVTSLIKELLDNYSPEKKVFFERLGRIFRLIISDGTRSLEPAWRIQDQWTDAVVTGKFHQLVISFVDDMSPEHVDYLISDVKARWILADNAQRYTLLYFACNLAMKTSQEHVKAEVLDMIGGFIWCLDTPTEFEDPCIDAQKKILSDCWNKDLVSHSILNCIQSIENRQKTVASLKLIRRLSYLFAVKTAATNDHFYLPNEFAQLVLWKYKEIYTFLDQEYQLFDLVVVELEAYMQAIRSLMNNGSDTQIKHQQENHETQVRERLTFLYVFLKYGQMYVDAFTAKRIWTCLLDGAVYPSDAELCFEWFSKVDLVPEGNWCIFNEHLLKLDPRQINQTAMSCFDRFFRAVEYSVGEFAVNESDPRPGLEFLWKVTQYADENVAQKAYELLRETIVYLGSQLISQQQLEICGEAIGNCLDKLRGSYLNTTAPATQDARTLTTEETMLMHRLSELVEKDIQDRFASPSDELMHEIEAPLLRFNVRTSVFVVKVTKKGRVLGQIKIKPSPTFSSGKFMQELGDFCCGNPRKIGRRVEKMNDASVHIKVKNAMFQPVVPEMLNYRIWLDSEQHSQKACQVGITGIQGSKRGSRVTGWQFVFLLRDTIGYQQPKSGRVQTSLLFGDVVQGIDIVKLLCFIRPQLCWGNEGLRFVLEAVN